MTEEKFENAKIVIKKLRDKRTELVVITSNKNYDLTIDLSFLPEKDAIIVKDLYLEMLKTDVDRLYKELEAL